MTARDLLDQILQHSIALQHYSNGQVRRILGILNKADEELFARLLVVLDGLPAGAAMSEYLMEMLGSVQRLNDAAYVRLGDELTRNLRELASVEAGFQFGVYSVYKVPVAAITAEAAWAAAYSRPFAGKLLKEAISELGEARARRIRDAVRMGFVQGKTTPQIVREIRGTKAKGFQDGFAEVDRRHLEAVVDTAVKHTAAGVRERFYEANKDWLGNLRWVSTLDGSTSPGCRLRDGKLYTNGERPKPVGHKVPWGGGPGRLHWRCRSVSVAMLPGETELYGTRSSVDGPVDANLTYGQWLKDQPAAVQDEVLGPVRGRLFRAGNFEIDRFYNDRGRMLTLDQLRERDAAMFKRAGV